LTSVFEKVAAITNIRDALKLTPLSPWAAYGIDRSLANHSHIRVDIRAPVEFRITGLKKEKLPAPEPVIFIQGSRVTPEAAKELMAFLIGKMREIKEVSLNIEDPDLTVFNSLVDQLISAGECGGFYGPANKGTKIRTIVVAENVKLEVLRVKRRKGGQTIPKVSELIVANATTLRVIGRVGLSEALVLNSTMHLERLSLMTFDLGFDASLSSIYDHLLEIARSGVTFKHLSYTSFVGFDPTDDVVQTFLDRCQVGSLRLTMMRGPYIPPQPDYMVGKVRRVNHVELGEVVEKPNIFNSLVTYESVFKKVFPNVQDIHYFQHW
uniref:Radical SAM protein n=1 Tax=Heligmosomoides polygyrus TaxID=6339 RepID=A0A183F898_HELPZ